MAFPFNLLAERLFSIFHDRLFISGVIASIDDCLMIN